MFLRKVATAGGNAHTILGGENHFRLKCEFTEIWEYDDVKHVQRPKGFILLCEMCHHVKHIGLAGILADKGKLAYNDVIEHFCKVNNCTKKDFEKHRTEAFDVWHERSQHEWKQDFGDYGKFIEK